MNLLNPHPNFSIVVPTGCNAHCDFCFWEKPTNTLPKDRYLERLKRVLAQLPAEFQQCSITGGEPTTLPWLKEILAQVRERFSKVVLSTNGHKLQTGMLKLIDHINISRHHHDDCTNYQIFGCDSVPDTTDLRNMCGLINLYGVDVTLNCVLAANFNSLYFIGDYIDFAKHVGANAVAFRKEHSDLTPMPVEQILSSKVIDRSECPVCKSETRLINGMTTHWKYSVKEPSNDLGGIYELVLHPNGKVTSDWAGKNRVSLLNKRNMNLAIQSAKAQFELDRSHIPACAGGPGEGPIRTSCGGGGCENTPSNRLRDSVLGSCHTITRC